MVGKHGLIRLVSEILVSNFKTHCIRILNDLHENGGEVVVTKRGRALVKIVPLHDDDGAKRVLGDSAQTCQILGDIVQLDASADWEALAS